MSMTVVIDAGHGGAERAGGSSPNNATGPNGLREKDLTLDLARRVAGALDGRFAVTLTRSSDANASLTDRARVAKDADADVFLSIHFNGASDPDTDGTEAWVAKSSNGGSHALARALLDRVVAVTRAPDRGVREADLGVLLPARQGLRTAATLLEVAFLTSSHEAERLAHDDYRQSLAQAIAAGITEWLGRPPAATATALVVAPPGRIDGTDCNAPDPLPSWVDLRADGIQFVIHKASEHDTYKDPLYASRHASARDADFLFGAYHFYRANASAADQVANFVDVVKRVLPGDLPPSFDFEEGGSGPDGLKASGVTGSGWLDPMTTFLDGVETAFGRTPMIYTSCQVWTGFVGNASAFAHFGDYPLWIKQYFDPPSARYADRLQRRPVSPMKKTPCFGVLPTPWESAPWENWAIWQYSGDFTPTEYTNLSSAVDAGGKKKEFDADVSNGGIHVLRGLADLGRPAPHGDSPRFVAYADENGTIMLLTFGRYWLESNLTDLARDAPAADGPRARGDVAACVIGDRQYVAFRNRADGRLYELERDLARLTVTASDVTAVAAGPNPASDPTYIVDGTTRAIAYWGTDDHQYLVVNPDGAWEQARDVTAGAGLDPASGAPALYVSGGNIHLVARAGAAGHVFDAWHDGVTWRSVDLTARSGAKPATYQPAIYTDATGEPQVVFRAVGGELQQIGTQNLTVVAVSQLSGAATCVGKPTAFVLDGIPHIVYRRTGGGLRDVAADGAGGFTDHPLPCAEAAADPGAASASDGGTAIGFVVFRGWDEAFHEAVLKAGTWSCQPVDVTAELSATASALATPTPVIETADTPLVPPERVVPAQACGVGKNADGTYTTRVPEVVLIHSLDSAAGYAGEIVNWRDGIGSERCFPPHYVIRNDGEITQMVAEKYISAHAGTWPMNVRAIGIEHDGYDNDPSYLTEAMYVSSAALVREICARWSIPVDRAHIIGHAEVPNQIKGQEHGDPGGYWDWDYYMALVRWDPADAAQKPLRQIVDTGSIAPGAAWHSEDRDSGRADWAAARHTMGPLFYSGYGDRYLWADGSADASDDDAVEFTFTAPRAGHWAVSAWWPILSSANQTTAIQIVPPDADQAVTQAFDQHVADWRRVWRTAALPAMPTWGLVGGADLQENDVVKVRVLRKSGAPGRVIADAVRFVNF